MHVTKYVGRALAQNKAECIMNAEKKKTFLEVCKACKAIASPTPGVREGTAFDSSRISRVNKVTMMSVSAALHSRVLRQVHQPSV